MLFFCKTASMPRPWPRDFTTSAGRASPPPLWPPPPSKDHSSRASPCPWRPAWSVPMPRAGRPSIEPPRIQLAGPHPAPKETPPLESPQAPGNEPQAPGNEPRGPLGGAGRVKSGPSPGPRA
jgi:hypothetical protein